MEIACKRLKEGVRTSSGLSSEKQGLVKGYRKKETSDRHKTSKYFRIIGTQTHISLSPDHARPNQAYKLHYYRVSNILKTSSDTPLDW